MKFGIIVFPGSNCDHDCQHLVKDVLGKRAELVWHREGSVDGFDCLIIPGGFSYGDYLRSGAMAACSPAMDRVRKFAEGGGLVIGICNGFQILQEAGLLPGALMRNRSLKFMCKDVHVRVERADTPFTNQCRVGEVLRLPIANMDGNFFVEKKVSEKLSRSGQVVLRYCSPEGDVNEDSNPNGSVDSVAGVLSEKLNVFGLMPHPERCAEGLLGNEDGLKIFNSILSWNTEKSR